jgi:signal peptidase I
MPPTRPTTPPSSSAPRPLLARIGWRRTVVAVGAVLVLRFGVIEGYVIPSGSMFPTLLVGDFVLVNHLRYGPAIPGTDAHIPGYAAPVRGDLVVFVSPVQTDVPADPTPTLIKRLVGLPGDTLLMEGGQLRVNGVAQTSRYQDPTVPADVRAPAFQWMDTAAVRGTRFGAPRTPARLEDWGPLVVPVGTYFMMGDNRRHSKDSRFLGFVPRADLRGRAWAIYYSSSTGARDPGVPGREPAHVRWARIFSILR